MTGHWPDVDALAQEIPSTGEPTVFTRAPGRLDVMGGIADYSGSLVLELPLREATCVALQLAEEKVLTILSGDRRFTIPLDETAGAYLRRSRTWAAYVAGAYPILMREKNVAFDHGARIFIASSVPEGRGVASSAALEVASMMAIDAAYNLDLSPDDIALLCQKVENDIVGAPCGVMDQMTAVFGEENRLLSLLCQPAEIQTSVAIPEELRFWGIDSGISHAVSGSDYVSVRTGTFMGYRLLREMAGGDWNGYLANLTPSELEHEYLHRLPETLSGREFIDHFGATDDSATTVDPTRTYRVRQPTSHPVYEHFRTRTFARLLSGDAIASAPLLGELMYRSHASYSACGLGSDGTDLLVGLARAAGSSRGIYGAKITGGGSGGTVAILARRDAEPAVRELAELYAERSGRKPYVFAGSSPGAAAFGHLWRP